MTSDDMDVCCPECGQRSAFVVRVTTYYRVDRHGAEQHLNLDWDDSAPAKCTSPDCNWFGLWGDLKPVPHVKEES